MRKMRRGRYVSVLVAASAIAACGGPDVEEVAYDDVGACQAAAAEPARCAESYDRARAEHDASAPRFQTAEACAAEGYENCQERAPGSFAPVMMGFLMAREVPAAGADCSKEPRPEGCPARGGFVYFARPLYYGNGGSIYAYDPGSDRPRSVGTRAPATGRIGAVRSVVRGGFGSTGAHMSGGG